jgi:cold shock CspA family protein
METGLIIRINESRGFGFIARPGAKDLFFHVSSLRDLPFDRDLINRRVTFQVAETERGQRAINIWPAGE